MISGRTDCVAPSPLAVCDEPKLFWRIPIDVDCNVRGCCTLNVGQLGRVIKDGKGVRCSHGEVSQTKPARERVVRLQFVESRHPSWMPLFIA